MIPIMLENKKGVERWFRGHDLDSREFYRDKVLMQSVGRIATVDAVTFLGIENLAAPVDLDFELADIGVVMLRGDPFFVEFFFSGKAGDIMRRFHEVLFADVVVDVPAGPEFRPAIMGGVSLAFQQNSVYAHAAEFLYNLGDKGVEGGMRHYVLGDELLHPDSFFGRDSCPAGKQPVINHRCRALLDGDIGEDRYIFFPYRRTSVSPESRSQQAEICFFYAHSAIPASIHLAAIASASLAAIPSDTS